MLNYDFYGALVLIIVVEVLVIIQKSHAIIVDFLEECIPCSKNLSLGCSQSVLGILDEAGDWVLGCSLVPSSLYIGAVPIGTDWHQARQGPSLVRMACYQLGCAAKAPGPFFLILCCCHLSVRVEERGRVTDRENKGEIIIKKREL